VKYVPMLFTGEMVRKLLDDSKTQTRRLVKPQPPAGLVPGGLVVESTDRKRLGRWSWRPDVDTYVRDAVSSRPPCLAEDRIWVRETLQRVESAIGTRPWVYAADQTPVQMRMDDPHVADMVAWAHHREDNERNFCPSIHMPRWASRITLEVTKVRVERLQDIPFHAIRAEGVSCPEHDFPGCFCCSECSDLRAEMSRLWDQINGKRAPWDANPWVWAIEFRRVD